MKAEPSRRAACPQTIDFAIRVALFTLAFGFSLAHPWSHAIVGETLYGDAAYWDVAAESWARGYIATKVPDIRPGYSLFLGAVYSLAGVDFRHAFIAQALIFGVAVAIVYAIGKRLGGRLAGIVAGLMLALDPYMDEWVALSTTEILGSVCNVAALFFLLRVFRRPHRPADAAAFGILLGYANIVRPLSLFFLAPAMLAMLFLIATAPGKRRAALALASAAGVALPLAFGVAYQYWRTRELGLSSNTAANFYGASSPKYRTWKPEIYSEVTALLQSRGMAATRQNMDAMFWRLTFRNYLQDPGFQIRRIAEGFGKYALFEGERERPERYTFSRPYLLAGGLLALAAALYRRGERKRLWVVAAAGALALLAPAGAIAVARGMGVLSGFRMLRRRPQAREVGWGLLASYWVLIGFSQALAGGAEGFLLHRLYTQVEPINTILVVLGALQAATIGLPKGVGLIRSLHLSRWARRLGPLAAPARWAGPTLAAVAGLAVTLGAARMAIANVAPPKPQLFAAPEAAELENLRKRIGLPRPVQYVGDLRKFLQVLPVLEQTTPPTRVDAYAVPGQMSRFLWYMDEQDRTEFWFFFGNSIRPASLEGARLMAEASRRLDLATFGRRYGLLVVAPANSYLISAGQPGLIDLITVRAFVPWDAQWNRFSMDRAVVFPLSTWLVDGARLAAARVDGQAGEGGPVAVNPGGPTLRTISLRPSLPVGQAGTRESAITFRNLEIRAGARFQSFTSVHPRLFQHFDSPPVTLQVWVSSGRTETLVGERLLQGKGKQDEQRYLPFQAALDRYAGQTVCLKLRAIGSGATPEMDEVLVGEPRIVTP